MLGWLRRYARWLHTRWPAGTIEKFPEARPDGSTRIPGVTIVGDLTGIPLLKFALDSGARAAGHPAKPGPVPVTTATLPYPHTSSPCDGRVMVKHAPWPGGLSTAMRPPWLATMR